MSSLYFSGPNAVSWKRLTPGVAFYINPQIYITIQDFKALLKSFDFEAYDTEFDFKALEIDF